MTGPKISVVAPCHGRQTSLDVLVASLGAQSLDPRSFEVILVDDGSPEPLVEPSAPPGLNLRILRHESARGPAAARNTGWRASSGEVIAFIDDDCRADTHWLETFVHAATAHPGGILQGRTAPDPDHEPAGPFGVTMNVGGADGLYETCNIAYPRSVLERVGGFDESFPLPCGEDVDLGRRAAKAGAPLEFLSSALVFHEVAHPTLRDHLAKIGRYTEAPRLLRAHPELRSYLAWGYLWKPSHVFPLATLASVVWSLAMRRPALAPPALLAWALSASRRRRGDRRFGRFAGTGRMMVIDLWEVITVARGSVEHRKLML